MSVVTPIIDYFKGLLDREPIRLATAVAATLVAGAAALNIVIDPDQAVAFVLALIGVNESARRKVSSPRTVREIKGGRG